MRLSTLTIVVFVVHTSTLAIAAPLPFTDDVQELVTRANDDPPASSSDTSGSNLRQAVSGLGYIPTRPGTSPLSVVLTAAQMTARMAHGAAQNSGAPEPSPHALHTPTNTQTPSPAEPQPNPATQPSRLFRPDPVQFYSPLPIAQQQRVRNTWRNYQAEQERSHGDQQSQPSGSGSSNTHEASPDGEAAPAHETSTAGTAAPTHKASVSGKGTAAPRVSSLARKSTSPTPKRVSPATTLKKASTVGKASPARKASTPGKGAAAHRASSSARKSTSSMPKRVSPVTTPKVSKAPRKRDLEIDELD